MILAITGHRPPKVGGYKIPNRIYNAVVEAIDRAFVELKPEKIISGMALGVDQWAAGIAVVNDIPFIAAVPFPSFSSKWPRESQREYQSLLGKASEVVFVSASLEYRPSMLRERNEWMVNRADQLLAVWNGSYGGTSSAVAMAERRGLTIHRAQIPQEIWDEAAVIERRFEDSKYARSEQFQQQQSLLVQQQRELEERVRALQEEEWQITHKKQLEEQQRQEEEARRRMSPLLELPRRKIEVGDE